MDYYSLHVYARRECQRPAEQNTFLGLADYYISAAITLPLGITQQGICRTGMAN